MARPRVHSDQVTLDAARDLVISGGTGAATTAAISSASRAPVGSLYHRFGSRGGLLAELWIRAVRRFQAGLELACAGAGPGIDRAMSGAGWVLDFAAEHPDDARLLLLFRREELTGQADAPGSARAGELETLNHPIRALLTQVTCEVFGTADERSLEATTLAVMDLPYAAVRRHLRAGSDPARFRTEILAAVRAILASAL
jgi:AcrR family transcriptional regulator